MLVRRAASAVCIKTLDKQLADIERDVDKHIEQHFKAQRKLLDSVKGVGAVTTLGLLSGLPELGGLGREPIAKLVGYRAAGRRLGQAQRTASHWGGRAEVRAALYMATLSAVRYNPVIARVLPTIACRGQAQESGAWSRACASC